jgi:LmbE family N-acetylglucosaminyl deacetylase
MNRNIVFIVAHPDDVARSFGGTALLLKDSYRLHVICASRGERGYYTWTGDGPTPPSRSLAIMRESEERAACQDLQASLTFLDLIDGEIFAERRVIEQVSTLLDGLRPIAVFTHGPLSKSDHAAISILTLQALHLSGLFWNTELYMSMWGGETLHGRYADIYVNISSVIEGKKTLIRHHHSQNPTDADVQQVIQRNLDLGNFAMCDYAEAFMTGMPPMARRSEKASSWLLMDLKA